MTTGLRARGQHAGALPQLLLSAGALVLEVDVGEVPLVQHHHGRAARDHRQLGDTEILRCDAVSGVADDECHVGALGRALERSEV